MPSVARPAALRGMARDARHAARPHAGARQARGGARAARAAAAARRAAPQRAWLGDADAAGSRRLGRARRRARPARLRGDRRAQRRPRRARPAHARPAGRRGHARRAGGRAPARGPGRDQPHAAGDALDDAARRGRRARDLRHGGRGRVLRGRDARGAGAGGRARAVPRPLDPGQRLVGVVRPRRRPLLGPARGAAGGRLHHAQRRRCRAGRRSAGGPAMRATRRRRSSPTPSPRRRGSRTPTLSPAAAHWDAKLGEFILDWDDIREGPDPHGLALQFAQSAVRHACAVCGWDPELAASARAFPRPCAEQPRRR